MHFLFPEAWYLLPLVVLPFLINLHRYLNRQSVTIPSLFFLEKILRKSSHRDARLWELLAELFFLFGLIFLLSRPVFSQPHLGHDRLLVFLDDSPSMSYHFIPPQNPFFESLGKMLEEKKYQQIDIFLLSHLNQEPYTFRSQEEINRFYRTIPTYLNGNWSVEMLRDFFLNRQAWYRDYDYMVYSDNKENHFSKESFSVLESAVPLNVALLPPSPSLQSPTLQQENFFLRENMELTLTIDPANDKEIFAVVTLDEKTVFRKQVPNVSPDQKTVKLDVKFPVVKDSSEDTFSVDGVSGRLSMSLEKNGVIFQQFNRVIYVYRPKTLALIPFDHPMVGFFETLFAYDVEKGNMALSPDPKSADTLLILDPTVDPKSVSSTLIQQMLFFLNPMESPVHLNQMLSKWGVNGFTVERKKITGVLDTLETSRGTINNKNERDHHTIPAVNLIKDYFVFRFFEPPDYVVATIQKQPVLFRYGKHAVFNGIGVEEMGLDINTLHLVWIYDLLFSLWGKKPVKYDHSPTSRIPAETLPPDIAKSLSSGGNGTPKIARGRQEEQVITVSTPPVEEFNSPASESRWSEVVTTVNTFLVADESFTEATSDLSSDKPLAETANFWDWISLVVLLEVALLGIITYAAVLRWRTV